jgi:tetratricopeptide (TPR) repeat protein
MLFRALGLVALFAFLLTPAPAPAGIAESWYVLRGRANMKIGNYRAAIEAFEKALQENPENRVAGLNLGLAYEADGQTDRAIVQFDRYLKRFQDDPDIAFKQAEYLGWSRYAYRRADAVGYYRMGLARRDDQRMRHKLARLLAGKKESVDEALAEYRRLLEIDPKNSTYQAEYRSLLLWDPRHRMQAIHEWSMVVAANPGDARSARQLAKLQAQEPQYRKEALARYRALLEKQPGDPSLRLEYARTLAADHDFEAARAQYRQLLAGRRDLEIGLELAALLSAEEETRPEAEALFAKLSSQAPHDARVRKGHARLLAAKRNTNAEAISEYESVLAFAPKDVEAHTGLARAYAWEGDTDQAIDHSEQALRADPDAVEARLLRQELMVGREPHVAPFVGLVFQPGDAYGLVGRIVGVAGRVDLSPFATLSPRGGYESYGSEGESAGGGFFALNLELRPSLAHRWELELGFRGMRKGDAAVEGRARYTYSDGALTLRPGFERRARSDSLTALSGRDAAGGALGLATQNLLFSEVEFRAGLWTLWAMPFAGWISQNAAGANFIAGSEARAERGLYGGVEQPFQLLGGARLSIFHHQRDCSAVVPSAREPLPGGYYSPPLWASASPVVIGRQEVRGSHLLELALGPALQWETGHGARVGASLDARVSKYLGPRWRWTAGGSFAQVGRAYSRFGVESDLGLLF